jgi:uncharacterized protein
MKLQTKSPRKKFSKRMALAGCSLGLGGTHYVATHEPTWVETNSITIPIANLPHSLNGFRIVQLSDLHHSRVVSRKYIQYCVTLANQLKPDLFLLTGDYVTNSARFAEPVAQELSRLQAPYGVVAVLGNHDYWTNGVIVYRALTNAGIRVLKNENFFLPVNGSGLWILGVDDLWAGEFNLDKTVSNTPSHEPRILLMHNPDTFMEAAQHGIDLVLSGHTHGGQVSLPICGTVDCAFQIWLALRVGFIPRWENTDVRQ